MNLNQPLLPERVYHIYNRGINREDLFKEERNYKYFLAKYAQYLNPIVETYAYCLMKNHFHLLVRVKEEITLKHYVDSNSKNSSGEKGLHSPDHIVSKQFARLFSSYTQAVNRSQGRTGSLFDTPFNRVCVEDDGYFTRLIWYIHYNPQKHGFVKDFKDYPHTSYHSHLLSGVTKLSRGKVLEWFGGIEEFQSFHMELQDESTIQKLIIE